MENNGEPKGNAGYTDEGKFSGALLCDGESWIEVPHDDSLTMDKKLTLMCWVNFSETGDFYQSRIWKNGPKRLGRAIV